MPEGAVTGYKAIFHSTVVCRTEYAHVKRNGVGRKSFPFEKRLVCLHYIGSDAIKHNVFTVAELTETVQCRGVCFGGSYFTVLFLFDDNGFHEIEQRAFLHIIVEPVDHIHCRVSHSPLFKPVDNAVDPVDVAPNSLADI